MTIPESFKTDIKTYVEKAKQIISKDKTMTEKDTETKLIEPLLTILKWELMSMDIKKGYPIKTEENTKEADYVLMIDSKPRMIIEAKKVTNSLKEENEKQLMRYAFYEKADLSILTNGNEWRIYDPYDLRDMIFEFSLDNMEDKLSYLWLLSKSSIENRLFDKEICKRLVVNEVYEYIKKNMEKWIDDINGLKEEIAEIFNMSINDKNQLLKDMISDSNLDDMEDKLDCLYLLSNDNIENDLDDRVLEKLLVVEEVYNYIKKNIEIWVNEIESKSKKFTKKDIIKIFSIAIKDINQLWDKLKVTVSDKPEIVISKEPIKEHKEYNIVEGQYALDDKFTGTNLRPIYNQLLAKVMEFGTDVKVNVRKIHISFIRNRVFAYIYIMKRKNLMDIEAEIEPSVNSNRIRNDTHLNIPPSYKGIYVSKVKDIDDELMGWLKQIYNKS